MSDYDPCYDPLHDVIPGTGMDYAPSYWVETAGVMPLTDGHLVCDKEVDVAIIGGGFSGLATAMFLAMEQGIKATVLEANQIGWGCTSRNGGQAHLAWGRLSRRQWAKRWGVDMAKRIHTDTLKGFAIFKSLIKNCPIDCEPYGDGNLLVAHCNAAMRRLKAESDFCNSVLSYHTKVLSTAQLHERYIGDHEACGALLEPQGMSIHPLKLAFGYLAIARQNGAVVHHSSPVLRWHSEGDIHYLHTPNAIVKAKAVVVATAGYTHASLHPMLAWRNMPIMANSAVTRPLSKIEIEACHINTKLPITDSRRLRYYYRLLPDNRLQIGTRSAISGDDCGNKKHFLLILDAICRKFPLLKDIKIEYFWSGWMDISHDMMPRIVQPDRTKRIYYAQGYSGNGVSFTAYAAKKLAQLVAGKPIDSNLPIFTSPLPKHPLRPFRRFGQRVLYGYYSCLDRLRV